MRAVQYFSDDYLKQTRDASTEQILDFLEQFRLMQSCSTQKSAASKVSAKRSPYLKFI